jgi:hypothetical protein
VARAKQTWPAWVHSWTDLDGTNRRTLDSAEHYIIRARLKTDVSRIVEIHVTEAQARHIVETMVDWARARPFKYGSVEET